MDGGSMQYSWPWAAADKEGPPNTSTSEKPAEDDPSAQAHSEVAGTANATQKDDIHNEALATKERVAGWVLEGGGNESPQNGTRSAQDRTASPAVAGGLDITEQTLDSNDGQAEGDDQVPQGMSASQSAAANHSVTEEMKVRYLKTIREFWGDDFDAGLPWPNPPGKTFLEDILRLIKNDKVTVGEFRKGILPVFRKRTGGKLGGMTGWARYISRTDLKNFLKKRDASNGIAGPANLNHGNPSSVMSSQRPSLGVQASQVVNGGEWTRPVQDSGNQEPPDDSLAFLVESPKRALVYSNNPSIENRRPSNRVPGNVPSQISWEPIQGTKAIARDSPGRPLDTRELTGQQTASETPREGPSPVNYLRRTTADVDAQRGVVSQLGSPHESNATTVYIKGTVVAAPPEIPQPANSPRAPPLPKCFTCENVVSPRWYPYVKDANDQSSSTLQENSNGPRPVEYQCERCHLEKRKASVPTVVPNPPVGGSMVLASQTQNNSGPSTPLATPKDTEPAPKVSKPPAPIHDGLPNLSGFKLPENNTPPVPNPYTTNGFNPSLSFPRKLYSPYPHAPAYQSVYNPHPGNSVPPQAQDQRPNPSAYQLPAATVPYQGLYHNSSAPQERIADNVNSNSHSQSAYEVNQENRSGGFTPVNSRTSQDSQSRNDSEARRVAFEAHLATKREEQLHQEQTTATSTNANANARTRMTKEVGAKKRSFSQIIDLTTDDSVVESIEGNDQQQEQQQQPPPPKMRKMHHQHQQQYQDQRSSHPNSTNVPNRPPMYVHHPDAVAQPNTNHFTTNNTTTTAPPPPPLSSYHYQPPPPPPQHQSPYFTTSHYNSAPPSGFSPSGPPPQPPAPRAPIKKVKKIEDTIEQDSSVYKLKSYDPSTVASDVLIAIGQHPERLGLNHHLERLKGQFGIDDNSDLSTVPEEAFGRSSDPNFPVYNMPPPIDEENSRMVPPAALLVRGPPGYSPYAGRGGGGATANFTPHRQSSLRHTSIPGPVPSAGFSVVVPSFSSSTSSIQPQPQPRDRGETRLGNGTTSTPKKRGRPALKTTPGYSSSSTPESSFSGARKKHVGKPFSKNIPPGYDPATNTVPFDFEYSNVKTPKFKVRTSSATPMPHPSGRKKHHGKPFSKNIPPGYDPVTNTLPEDFDYAAWRKKAGKAVKNNSPEPPPPPVEGKFVSFLCEWRDCPADLHNLDTLSAHVFVNHTRRGPNGGIPCLWANCNDQKNGCGVLEFGTEGEWREHMTSKHLKVVAWHMGDGPRGTSLAQEDAGYVSSSSSKHSRSFLCDSNGREVTPSIKDQRIESGRARDNNEKRFRTKREGIDTVLEKIPGAGAIPPEREVRSAASGSPMRMSSPVVVVEMTKPIAGTPVFDGDETEDEEDTEKNEDVGRDEEDKGKGYENYDDEVQGEKGESLEKDNIVDREEKDVSSNTARDEEMMDTDDVVEVDRPISSGPLKTADGLEKHHPEIGRPKEGPEEQSDEGSDEKENDDVVMVG